MVATEAVPDKGQFGFGELIDLHGLGLYLARDGNDGVGVLRTGEGKLSIAGSGFITHEVGSVTRDDVGNAGFVSEGGGYPDVMGVDDVGLECGNSGLEVLPPCLEVGVHLRIAELVEGGVAVGMGGEAGEVKVELGGLVMIVFK